MAPSRRTSSSFILCKAVCTELLFVFIALRSCRINLRPHAMTSEYRSMHVKSSAAYLIRSELLDPGQCRVPEGA